ncbi:MAG: DUF938 domain-containing protein [Pseudomonadota bacterium]
MQPENVIAEFEAVFQSPAALRNREPLLAALQPRLPTDGTVLEVAAGALTHALAFAGAHPTLTWLPSEVDARILARVSEYVRCLEKTGQLPSNLLSPIELDVCQAPWPLEELAAIYTANLLHISPAACSTGLFCGAGEHLAADGKLLIYGPFKVAGCFTSDGDARFDLSLRARNAAWGIRDLETLIAEARTAGLALTERLPMPANNWLLTFERERQ